jgi:hypothetical protein
MHICSAPLSFCSGAPRWCLCRRCSASASRLSPPLCNWRRTLHRSLSHSPSLMDRAACCTAFAATCCRAGPAAGKCPSACVHSRSCRIVCVMPYSVCSHVITHHGITAASACGCCDCRRLCFGFARSPRYDVGRRRLPEALCVVSRHPHYAFFHHMLSVVHSVRLVRFTPVIAVCAVLVSKAN